MSNVSIRSTSGPTRLYFWLSQFLILWAARLSAVWLLLLVCVKKKKEFLISIIIPWLCLLLSCYGAVQSLSGDAERDVAVEAVGQGECSLYSEDTVTDEEGRFRLRGLLVRPRGTLLILINFLRLWRLTVKKKFLLASTVYFDCTSCNFSALNHLN